ncbi:DUF6179 domain-containing protein [Eubacteriaceae bacterium ES3]|nr:DUF6179 domain-containing protein [Eubacteriaceae bacterium ES3]
MIAKESVMNSVIHNRIIDPNSLDPANYCQSLLRIGYLYGLIDKEASYSIQIQLLELLKSQIDSYTRSQSTSVLTEVAEALYKSILYTISLAIKPLPSPETAIDSLKTSPLTVLFNTGLRIANQKSYTAQILFKQIQKSRLQTDNIAYQSTIEKGLHPFFNAYRPRYFAHDLPGLNIDYPLLVPITNLTGIEYFLKTLTSLKLENHFCLSFDPQQIHMVLSSHDENYHDLLINISYQLLKNALACTYLKKPLHDLTLTPDDLSILAQKFKGCNRKSLLAIFEQQLVLLFKAHNLSSSGCDYFKLALPELTAELDTALKNKTIDKFFALYKEKPLNRILFSTAEPMPPSDYQEFIEEFKSCRFQSDQLAMIQLSVHSLIDFKKILLEQLFSISQAKAVFDLLSNSDLAAFYQYYMFPMVEGNAEFSGDELYLSTLLQSYLSVLTPEHQEQIRLLSSRLIISPENFY